MWNLYKDLFTYLMFGHVCLTAKVLNGNHDAAALLAQLVHQDVTIAMDSDLATVEAEVSVEDIGIWIDPIGDWAERDYQLISTNLS